MKAFAQLLVQLAYSPGRLAKLALLQRFFATVPDPERGWALAALTDELKFKAAKAGLIREVANARLDPVLLALSYDFVGDLAETVSLMWPANATGAPPELNDIIHALSTAPKARLPDLLTGWLTQSGPDERYAILKLITGGLRVGVSARLTKSALASYAHSLGQQITEMDVEEVWHGLTPPYSAFFAWLQGRGPKPQPGDAPLFRAPMLAHPLEQADLAAITPADYVAEWKWDGTRVQLVRTAGGTRLYSRTGEDITGAFPELAGVLAADAVLDGELLVVRDGAVARFADVQQRLNRRTVSTRLMRDFPVQIKLYDILFAGADDVRACTWEQRRALLEHFIQKYPNPRLDISEIIVFDSVAQLSEMRAGARAASQEGLMLKRRDSPYIAGRPKGFWWKYKRAPLLIDAVLMYAQRGHGKRGGYYSDYTFGVWQAPGALVPVGKAYFGFTDAELVQLDRWIRSHTLQSFGPVREVEQKLVLEIAFDGVQLSNRHKSGIALRFPRVARLRWDKPAEQADSLATLHALLHAA